VSGSAADRRGRPIGERGQIGGLADAFMKRRGERLRHPHRRWFQPLSAGCSSGFSGYTDVPAETRTLTPGGPWSIHCDATSVSGRTGSTSAERCALPCRSSGVGRDRLDRQSRRRVRRAATHLGGVHRPVLGGISRFALDFGDSSGRPRPGHAGLDGSCRHAGAGLPDPGSNMEQQARGLALVPDARRPGARRIREHCRVGRRLDGCPGHGRRDRSGAAAGGTCQQGENEIPGCHQPRSAAAAPIIGRADPSSGRAQPRSRGCTASQPR